MSQTSYPGLERCSQNAQRAYRTMYPIWGVEDPFQVKHVMVDTGLTLTEANEAISNLVVWYFVTVHASGLWRFEHCTGGAA